MNYQAVKSFGFNVTEKQFSWISSHRDEWVESAMQAQDPINLWTLDKENLEYTSHIAGFPAITVEIFVSGAHAVMTPESSPQALLLIDDSGDGKSNAIYKETTADEFFSSFG